MFDYGDNQFIISPPCELVSSKTKSIKELIEQEIHNHRDKWLTLIWNFAEVTTIDAHGAGLLMHYYEEMQKTDQQMIMIDVNLSILSTLKLLRLDKYITIGLNQSSAQLEETRLRQEQKQLLEERHQNMSGRHTRFGTVS